MCPYTGMEVEEMSPGRLPFSASCSSATVSNGMLNACWVEHIQGPHLTTLAHGWNSASLCLLMVLQKLVWSCEIVCSRVYFR